MNEEALYVFGQALGILAVVFGFISFQMRSSGGILFLQIITALTFSLHYLFIGAMTAMALNLIAAIKCACYYLRDKRGGKSPLLPIIFTSLVVMTSVLTWEGWFSILIMLGLVVNSVSLALDNARIIKLSVYIKSPLCLAYNAIVASGGGVIYECAVLISSTVSLLREKYGSASVKNENREDGKRTECESGKI